MARLGPRNQSPDRSKYDLQKWHYVNVPILLDGTRPAKVNLAMGQPRGPAKEWNVAQATRFCLTMIEGDDAPHQQALAYCWLFHLVGDLHQPLHSTAIFCERFPEGDRGGNSIPTKQGRNLHSLWDNLLGRDHKLNSVRRVSLQLQARPEDWTVDTETDLQEWLEESHALAKSFAYSPAIVAAVRSDVEKLAPIDVGEEYLVEAGRHARSRIVAAGVRLATLLGDEQAPGPPAAP